MWEFATSLVEHSHRLIIVKRLTSLEEAEFASSPALADWYADATNRIKSCSILMVAKAFSKCLYFITRIPKFMIASCFMFESVHVIVKLMWVLKNYPQIKADAEKNDAAFGTLDSWLIHKFGIEKHVTDYSQASATAMFDPTTLSWMYPVLKILGIPWSILPSVEDSSGTHLLEIPSSVFGTSIPLRASIADQPASMFGSYCFKKDSVKLTLGTGAFLNFNAGSTVPAMAQGFSPIVAWKISDNVTYAGECNASDLGTIVDWAVGAGLCKDVEDCTEKAKSVHSSDGVFFIPLFNGLKALSNYSTPSCSFIGIKNTTQVPHMLRAVLESLAFLAGSLFENYAKTTNPPPTEIRVDGGVANNDFILQKLSNITGVNVVRWTNVERTSIGAAYLAGLANGFWNNIDQLERDDGLRKTFTPCPDETEGDKLTYSQWQDLMTSFCEKTKGKKNL